MVPEVFKVYQNRSKDPVWAQNDFGHVPIVLDRPNLFCLGSNHFNQVQIIKIGQ